MIQQILLTSQSGDQRISPIALYKYLIVSLQDKLTALVKASQAFQEQPTEMEALWDSCSCLLYSLEDRQKQLGLGDKVGACYLQLSREQRRSGTLSVDACLLSSVHAGPM